MDNKTSVDGIPCTKYFCMREPLQAEIIFLKNQKAQLITVCKQALEALQWNWGGEPLPTLELAAIDELKRVLSECV